MITKKPFGIYNGQQTTLYTIKDGDYSVSVCDFGATIISFVCPDKDGNPTDIVLGHDDVKDYAPLKGYLGATVGRFANRIKNGKFTLNGQQYQLFVNDGPNALHGGKNNFSNKIYNVTENGNSLKFSAVSPDMEEGFPGRLEFSVTFTLTNGELRLDYKAISDKDTIINLTNHSYFNLNGGGDIYDTYIKVNADGFCRNDSGNLPTGEIVDVSGTDMDLREYRRFGDFLNSSYPDIKSTGGVDHNFVYSDKSVDNPLHLCAEAKSVKTGIKLSCLTTLPGVQLYTANGLNDKTGKNGAVYGKHYAFCLETQNFPDSVNKPNFPSPILKKGEEYKTTTIYKITTEE